MWSNVVVIKRRINRQVLPTPKYHLLSHSRVSYVASSWNRTWLLSDNVCFVAVWQMCSVSTTKAYQVIIICCRGWWQPWLRFGQRLPCSAVAVVGESQAVQRYSRSAWSTVHRYAEGLPEERRTALQQDVWGSSAPLLFVQCCKIGRNNASTNCYQTAAYVIGRTY